MSDTTDVRQQEWFLKSTFPVFFPDHPALACSNAAFETFLRRDVKSFEYTRAHHEPKQDEAEDDTTLVTGTSTTTSGEIRGALDDMNIESEDSTVATEGASRKSAWDNGHPFMNAMHGSNKSTERDMTNTMQTENADLAHRSTTDPLVDLFSELEDVVSGPRLRELLDSAWQKDPLSTLKIIFNARSIHIGKSSRTATYRCFGWLAQNHPVTLLHNLQWLTRPIIEKKLGEKKEDDDMVIVEEEKSDDDITRFDVKNGVAHGYWKDLLNILALAVDGKLHVLTDPRELLNIEAKKNKKGRNWSASKAKELRKETKACRHAAAIKAFEDNSFYRGLHLTIARLFADQLRIDLQLYRKDDKKAARQISLCAKWAPSTGLFHDKHTFIVSSIAELLHPEAEFRGITDRSLYLRHAREAYRKDISVLRKSLEVVERDIAALTFENIKYDRVPSLAMSKYAGLFAKKDADRFEEFISNVAEGKMNISGATLLPSKLVAAVRETSSRYYNTHTSTSTPKKGGTKALVEAKLKNTEAGVLNGQWNTLVQRIKDSGKLENSIAVADVSGSMSSPRFPDGTCPMDSSIGLSLLLAEVTAPPFGGSFITFSTDPTIQEVRGDTLQEKVVNLESADWAMSTNFEAVFTKLILPLARGHNLKQADMVKQVFVFSDMQFNSASSQQEQWSTSYERIKKKFALYGYEMPKLVFWNLAGGRAGVTGVGDPVAPKPVTADEEGTALVSGYSQGMLKVFLDNGSFEDPEAEEEVFEEEMKEVGEDGEEVVQVMKKQRMDPSSTVRKAISHKAYSMLQVVD